MAPIELPTTPESNIVPALAPAWVLGGVLLYLLVVFIVIFVRQCFVERGFCAECNCCATWSEDCRDCLFRCAEACDCPIPDFQACCDTICGPRRKFNIADYMPDECCKKDFFELPECPGCPEVDCEKPECNEIVCCCIRIKLNSHPTPVPQIQ